MKKMIFRIFLKTIFFGLFAFSLVLCIPNSFAALNYRERLGDIEGGIGGSREELRKEFVCENIQRALDRIQSRIKIREEEVSTKENERMEKKSQRRTIQDERLSKIRKRWDERREIHFQNLLEKNSLDEEKKAAVKVYIETVHNAVMVRKEAIDSAVENYRAGLDLALETRRENVDQAKGRYEETVRSAFEKASSECNDADDSLSVRVNLHENIKSIRETFRADRKNAYDEFTASHQNLITVRKSEVEKAVSDFQNILLQATEVLKNTLNEESVQ